jgi:UDP-N-acetylglucosamine 1-carboxyvinyltransferase (EC 2.5.1.7)
MVAEGQTRVTEIYHVERGYVDIVKKLSSLGANIEKNRGLILSK